MPDLRVCGIVPIYTHPDWRGGGLARTATDLLMELARRGNHVTVISPLLDGDQRFNRPERTSFFDGNLNLLYSDAAKASPLGFGTTADGLGELLEPVLDRSDVVHIHSFMSRWTDAAARRAQRRGIPYVIQDHGKLTPSVLKNRAVAKRMYMAFGGRAVLRNAAMVVPSSEVVARHIRAWDPMIRCMACTNGLEEADFQGTLPPRPIAEPYVLFLGWLDPRKNPDLLVRAFASIAEQTGDWKLALVGPDSYQMLDGLKGLIAKLGVTERVVVPGPVRGEAKLAWVRNAGIFVLPSEGEGLSLAMLEAAASGVPLLLSEGCNYPEAEEHNAGLTLPLRPEAWAEAMLGWIRNPAERLRVGTNARRLFLSDHTLRAVGARLERLLMGAARTRAEEKPDDSAFKDHHVVDEVAGS